MNAQNKTEKITLAGGCFWCLEAAFETLEGVIDVESGYAGGFTENPTYKEVCSGTTGYAEVVQITYNPQIIGFTDILEVFFTIHDPTTLNRQGMDIGTQYRSEIFYHTEDQMKTALEVINNLNNMKIFRDNIVTRVSAVSNYYRAEEYHQDYFENNPNNGYCQFTIVPKLSKMKKYFESRLKPDFK